jgi:Family of unknown function (DUF5681)
MSDKSAETYEVGYGKPPKATRFQKGRSGNPGGRPKKVVQPLDPGAVLQAVENEEIIVLENGKRKPMRKVEAHLRQLFTKAIKSDLKAARILVNMGEDYFAQEASADWQTEVIGISDARRRYGKNWPKKVDELNAPYRSYQ